jgi:hypothetical protein
MRARFMKLMMISLLVLLAMNSLADALLGIRAGNCSIGHVILTVDGNKVRHGDSSFCRVIFTIDGKKLREGDSSFGRILATAGNNVWVLIGDSSFGKATATVTGSQVREGDSSYGKVIATIKGGQMSGVAAAVFLLLR